ncbi:MAG: hypothetical protein H8E53_10920, partial [Planctomycetes bacterium]|nr:hypothetical protein [Planctomycetota bacterium]
MRRQFQLSVCIFLVLGAALGTGAEKPDIIVGAVLQQWKFDSGLTGWEAVHHCKISAAGGAMKIVSSGNDPYLSVRLEAPGPALVIKLRARSNAGGAGQFFWSTGRQGGFAEARSKRFEMIHDGKWHEYTLHIRVDGTMKSLRFDPAGAAGTIEIDSLAVHRARTHPLEIERIETRKDSVILHVRNVSPSPVTFDISEKTHTVAGGKTISVTRKLSGKGPFERCNVTLTSKDLPTIRRSVLVFRPEAGKDSDFRATVGTGDLKLRIPDFGHGARIEYKGKLVGILGPIARLGWRVHSFGFPA